MQWIFLSPHFDDAAFSCGGLIWERTQAGDAVQILTICAGEIPPGDLSAFAVELHQRWETGREAIYQRKEEDARACETIGASSHYFPIPDCIYRRAGVNYWQPTSKPMQDEQPRGELLYPASKDLWGPTHPAENLLIQQLGDKLTQELPEAARLVCPLGIGAHVDHRLTRIAAEMCGRPLWYYADFPYVQKDPELVDRLSSQGWLERLFEISPHGLQAWYEAMAAYQSQISTFWEDLPELRHSLESYLAQMGGAMLWQPARIS
jgi:LmbE family N-acetylglucosaminyl deacetylase